MDFKRLDQIYNELKKAYEETEKNYNDLKALYEGNSEEKAK